MYRLFPDKLALFAAVVDSHRQEMLDLQDDYDHLPLHEALARIFRIDLDSESEEKRRELFRMVDVESRSHPELREIMRSRGGRTARRDLARWLLRQVENGRMVLDDPEIGARMLMNMIFGSGHPQGREPEFGPEQRREYARRCIDVFLHGVLPSPAP